MELARSDGFLGTTGTCMGGTMAVPRVVVCRENISRFILKCASSILAPSWNRGDIGWVSRDLFPPESVPFSPIPAAGWPGTWLVEFAALRAVLVRNW